MAWVSAHVNPGQGRPRAAAENLPTGQSIRSIVGFSAGGIALGSWGRRCWPRLTAPVMTLTPSPMMIRSAIICPVSNSRAASLVGVMSPNPTVANTVTVKYSASVRSAAG